MSNRIRSTQRAPKSCTICYARKVKCSKDIPCRQCVDRGCPLECKREVVRIRGRLHLPETIVSSPTYAELLQENARLRGLLTGVKQGQSATANLDKRISVDRVEQYEIRLFDLVERTQYPRSVRREEDILMPSRDCSEKVVRDAPRWTFWIHFAVYSPKFSQEHDEFWQRFSRQGSFDVVEPLWLSIYFSILASTLLFMDEQAVVSSSPPIEDSAALLRNWYSAALFFLDKGDFTRRNHINVVQAIAILGIVFNNVGDIVRYRTLWAVAIRIAQNLQLGNDHAHSQETVDAQQARRRLWWTLVICEWLPVPYHSPFISDTDFQCQFPDEVDDDELGRVPTSRLSRTKPRPVRYHITMIKVAKIYYRFRYKLRIRNLTPEEATNLALEADNELAGLISDLPPYLDFDEQFTALVASRDAQLPWIPWQKRNLALVFHHYRIAINRVIQPHWVSGSLNAKRVRAICLSSAQAIINTITQEHADTSKLRTWAVAINIFMASVTLALETASPMRSDSTNLDYVEKALQFLRIMSSQSLLAQHGVQLLGEIHEVAIRVNFSRT